MIELKWNLHEHLLCSLDLDHIGEWMQSADHMQDSMFAIAWRNPQSMQDDWRLWRKSDRCSRYNCLSSSVNLIYSSMANKECILIGRFTHERSRNPNHDEYIQKIAKSLRIPVIAK